MKSILVVGRPSMRSRRRTQKMSNAVVKRLRCVHARAQVAIFGIKCGAWCRCRMDITANYTQSANANTCEPCTHVVVVVVARTHAHKTYTRRASSGTRRMLLRRGVKALIHRARWVAVALWTEPAYMHTYKCTPVLLNIATAACKSCATHNPHNVHLILTNLVCLHLPPTQVPTRARAKEQSITKSLHH